MLFASRGASLLLLCRPLRAVRSNLQYGIGVSSAIGKYLLLCRPLRAVRTVLQYGTVVSSAFGKYDFSRLQPVLVMVCIAYCAFSVRCVIFLC